SPILNASFKFDYGRVSVAYHHGIGSVGVGAAVTPGRIGGVDRIVAGERVRIARAAAVAGEERVAAEESADDRIVQSRADLGDAERREQVASVPLLARVELRSRLRVGPRRGRLPVGCVVGVLRDDAVQ